MVLSRNMLFLDNKKAFMDLITAIKTCFKKYFVFKGRAKKSEYWWFFLFCILAGTVTAFLDVVVLGYAWAQYGPINTIVNLILIIPILSAGARRLHDTNKSGWWQLLGLIGLAISYYQKDMLTKGLITSSYFILSFLALGTYILLIVWLASKGEKKKNKYGAPIIIKSQRN